jgi:putative inorganic carbon (hco3(-)) transporter
MRDLVVTLIVFGSLPLILKRPYIGILMWVWISVMNPHRQSWGFAASFPFAAIIAAVTLLSLLSTKESKNLPLTSVTCVLLAFIFWINVSTFFALHPDQVYGQWNRVMKIMGMTIVALMILKTKKHIQLFICVLVFSLAFYGVKGGVFTILSGGRYRVWGPDGTFIGGNNEIALALIMVIPLIHYLQGLTSKRWVRHALAGAMVLCALAALGSYSRGALLAIAAMGGFLWLKSNKKFVLGLLMVLTIPVLVMFMPQQWEERMNTINTYQEDSSAMGRINAWWMAFNLAKDRPLVGGGFEIYDNMTFERYAPVPTDVHAAHSIYFQVLGEHGFVGLGLYLLLGFLTWRCGSWITRNTKKRDDLMWAYRLAAMTQVSLIGFAVGGAFLSLLYFDVPYYLVTAMVVTRIIVQKELQSESCTPTSGWYVNASTAFDDRSLRQATNRIG